MILQRKRKLGGREDMAVDISLYVGIITGAFMMLIFLVFTGDI